MPRAKSAFTGPFEKLTQLSYTSLFSLWFCLVVLFAFGYYLLGIFVPSHAPQEFLPMTVERVFWNSFYFSVITATSTGYGDITPWGFSKFLASVQSILALMIFATFVTKLVSHRQEVALRQVHKLTFEDVFHNTREGLYIIRQDFTRIMEDAQEHGSLTEEHWSDLTIAYQQAQSMLQEIPVFYADEEQKLYTIDERREKLLHEAVHRTLHRINRMLDVLSLHNIDWAEHEPSVRELRGLVEIVDAIMPLWEKESPYTEVFEDIVHLNSRIHDRLFGMITEKDANQPADAGGGG